MSSSAREALVDDRLLAVRGISDAAGAVVDTLYRGSSQLQRIVHDSDILKPALNDQDPLVKRASLNLVEACGAISLALAGLAVALSGDVKQPLDRLARVVSLDKSQRAAEREVLGNQHKVCATAVGESRKWKARISSQLQEAVGDSSKRRPSQLSWLTGGSPAANTARIEQMMSQQSLAVQNHAGCVDRCQAVMDELLEKDNQLDDVYVYIDYATKRALWRSLCGCSKAWQSAAGSLAEAADRLQTEALQIDAPSPKLRTPWPAWAHEQKEDFPDMVSSTREMFRRDHEMPTRRQCDHRQVAECSGPSEGPEDKNDENEDVTLPIADAHLAGPVIMGTVVESSKSPVGAASGIDGGMLMSEVDAALTSDTKDALREQWAELEARKSELQEAHEEREIRLLERESDLLAFQANLEAQQQTLAERRRSMALEQARALSELERGSVTSVAESFALSRHPTQQLAAEPGEEDAPEEEHDGEEDDETYDFDWAAVPSQNGTDGQWQSSGHQTLHANEVNATDPKVACPMEEANEEVESAENATTCLQPCKEPSNSDRQTEGIGQAGNSSGATLVSGVEDSNACSASLPHQSGQAATMHRSSSPFSSSPAAARSARSTSDELEEL